MGGRVVRCRDEPLWSPGWEWLWFAWGPGLRRSRALRQPGALSVDPGCHVASGAGLWDFAIFSQGCLVEERCKIKSIVLFRHDHVVARLYALPSEVEDV